MRIITNIVGGKENYVVTENLEEKGLIYTQLKVALYIKRDLYNVRYWFRWLVPFHGTKKGRRGGGRGGEICQDLYVL